MTSDPKAMVQKLWDFYDVLRDDGLSAGTTWSISPMCCC